jgi:DNA-binding transcriptional LysR family regulator
MLLGDHLDAAILWVPPADRHFASAVIAEVPYLVALPADLPLPDGQPLPRSIFERYPVALWDRSDGEMEYDYWTGLISEGGPRARFASSRCHCTTTRRTRCSAPSPTAVRLRS